jgi:sugar phosphate isomerase/epimerase
MKVSFGSWAFTFGPYASHPLNFLESARKIAAAGYDGVEVSGFPPHLTIEASGRALHEGRKQLLDLGLEVSGYVPDFTMVNPIVEANHAKYLDKFRRAVEVCAELGSPLVRVDTIAAPGSIGEAEYRDTADRLAGLWRDASELAAASGVRMVWEFEPGFVFNKPSEVVDIYEQVGHPNFQILFDTCHAYLCGVVGARQQGEMETLRGGVEEFLNMLSGRIGHVHIVDTDGTLYGEETSTHSLFGDGVIDFVSLAPKLKAVPGIQWWCVDFSFRADTEAQMQTALKFVRGLAG